MIIDLTVHVVPSVDPMKPHDVVEVDDVRVFCEPAVGDQLALRDERLAGLASMRVIGRIVREMSLDVTVEARRVDP